MNIDTVPNDLASDNASEHQICVVAVAYYPSYFDNMRKIISKIAEIAEISVLVIVVNNPKIEINDSTNKFGGLCQKYLIHRHDNDGLEFGGYQAGIDILKREMPSYFDVIMLNDTLGLHYPIYKEGIKAFVRALTVRNRSNWVVGTIEMAERRLRIDDLVCTRWVRSNLIGFDYHSLAAIDFTIYLPELMIYISDSPKLEVFFSDNIGSVAKDKISQWLFEKQFGWYGAAPLTRANSSAMALKARSIIQEFHLSMRLERCSTLFLAPHLTRFERITAKIKSITQRLLDTVGLKFLPERHSWGGDKLS